ncbi:zinc-binding alcohol dehydrogenase family protein [Mycolicibacterium rhodesiae]|uniref:Zinc-type alcohol dehydrogenase-like protein n=1 Tax=Mycolicibacterium rhodesiae TaxID=36814 RepID=A0A1X0J465_MYCRH|nr:zinc-binding alcohol dehydrogenase family protein [Mycolicibacterium rhodesiae]MCV7345541.1 zinc-binding alcohol dehydrogenase family protein [Mycolicibacterium rhodesiae]ORB56939.1 NADPH:quinone reductase [Mycolicibacterium rhodesiae]
MATMTAVGSYAGLPIDDPQALQDVQIDIPELRPRDVLVEVAAVSVNPVDIKRRQALEPSSTPVILGFDAAGVVTAVGPDVSTLSVGDEVWYAGDISRPGTNAQLHAVDERIVSRKPRSLSFADAAALPLTTITAWESLFDRFELSRESRGDLLIMGAAGGVGSVMIQLAKALTGVRVIGTASRAESRQWAADLGADAVINHHNLRSEALAAAPDGIDWVFSPHSAGNVEDYAEILKPFGHVAAIDDPKDLDLMPLKTKSIAWHWEFMFTKPLFGLPGQQELLAATAQLVDDGIIRSTVTNTIEDFSAEGLREAHKAVESGRMVGKVVVRR